MFVVLSPGYALGQQQDLISLKVSDVPFVKVFPHIYGISSPPGKDHSVDEELAVKKFTSGNSDGKGVEGNRIEFQDSG